MLICNTILSNSVENTQATNASKLQYHNYPNLSADMPMLWGSHCAFDIPLPDCSLGSLFISKFKIAKTKMIICLYSYLNTLIRMSDDIQQVIHHPIDVPFQMLALMRQACFGWLQYDHRRSGLTGSGICMRCLSNIQT